MDAFDEMTNDRPYRKALARPQALEMLERGGGSQWERRLVETFTALQAPTGTVAAVKRSSRRGG